MIKLNTFKLPPLDYPPRRELASVFSHSALYVESLEVRCNQNQPGPCSGMPPSCTPHGSRVIIV